MRKGSHEVLILNEHAHMSKEREPNIGGNGGKLFGYIFTVSTLKFALDTTVNLESLQKSV